MYEKMEILWKNSNFLIFPVPYQYRTHVFDSFIAMKRSIKTQQFRNTLSSALGSVGKKNIPIKMFVLHVCDSLILWSASLHFFSGQKCSFSREPASPRLRKMIEKCIFISFPSVPPWWYHTEFPPPGSFPCKWAFAARREKALCVPNSNEFAISYSLNWLSLLHNNERRFWHTIAEIFEISGFCFEMFRRETFRPAVLVFTDERKYKELSHWSPTCLGMTFPGNEVISHYWSLKVRSAAWKTRFELKIVVF